MAPPHRIIRPLLALHVLATVLLGASPADAAGIKAQPVLTGLDFPAAMTVAPDGKIFYGERLTGRIYVYNPTTKTKKLFFTVSNIGTARQAGINAGTDALHGGDKGLYGLTLHPKYPSTPYVYASAARVFSGDVHKRQVLRITDSGGTGTGLKVLLSQAAGTDHQGGRILFGPDGMLYDVIGDGGVPANAQKLSNNYGKVLRMTPGGGVPAGNPFGNRIWAYGIRNSFGFDFDPSTGRLWETENGPECNDELNLIMKGRNYGWGDSAACGSPPKASDTNRDGPNPVMPKALYNPPPALTGAAFCSGSCGLGSASAGRLFFGDWNTGKIRRATLNSTRTAVASQGVVYDHPSGVLAMETGPTGQIYFSTGTGIYRLVLG